MDIIISNASTLPIYEQIVVQMKDFILSGELEEGQQLPSIRALASDLRISVITTKRAYAELEAQGFVETVQGKGSFVAGGNAEFLREERLREVLLRAAAGGVDGLCGKVLDELDRFTGSALDDDIALVALRFDREGRTDRAAL